MPIPHHSRRYNRRHRRRRLADIAAYQPGDPCALCGDPMTDPPSLLDEAHNDAGGYLGLAHRRCNRGYGQAETNRGMTQDPQPRPTTKW